MIVSNTSAWIFSRCGASKDNKDISSDSNGHQAIFQNEKIAFAAAAAMHAAANSAAVAAASGGNLADYLWSPQPSSVSGGSMIPHPLSLQHLRPPTHATSLMSHFASSNNAAQLQTSPHLPFPTNPFFWPKRAFETPADSLLGIFGINILHVVLHTIKSLDMGHQQLNFYFIL